jgi:DNA-binding MarR family transcriptional regulator
VSQYDDRREHGLGILAARLLFAVQDELYAGLRVAGHEEITPAHGAVLAHLDEGGTRATDLARRSGRHKQVIGRIVDELDALGYVERRPDPADRRAKLVVPTDRGLDAMRRSDRIIGDIERRQSELLGAEGYEAFKEAMGAVVDSLRGDPGSNP